MEQTQEQSMENIILETAERLFLDKGFALTSTTEIAREAGCNQALVHYYFRTKEQLFIRIFEEKIKIFAGAFFSIDEKPGTFLEKLKRKIEAHFDIIARNPKIPFLLINEITTNPQRIQALHKSIGDYPTEIIRKMSEELNEAIARGEVRPITVLDLILTVLSLNVLPQLLRPILEEVMPLPPEEVQKLIARRKEENVKLIINSLRP
ncbi:TetR/AcrR family transcriptional regulator [Alistipes indistinctus]|nr:TetR/AcrR family transcriptional regulator [Alistipes indistinctus]